MLIKITDKHSRHFGKIMFVNEIIKNYILAQEGANEYSFLHDQYEMYHPTKKEVQMLITDSIGFFKQGKYKEPLNNKHLKSELEEHKKIMARIQEKIKRDQALHRANLQVPF